MPDDVGAHVQPVPAPGPLCALALAALGAIPSHTVALALRPHGTSGPNRLRTGHGVSGAGVQPGPVRGALLALAVAALRASPHERVALALQPENTLRPERLRQRVLQRRDFVGARRDAEQPRPLAGAAVVAAVHPVAEGREPAAVGAPHTFAAFWRVGGGDLQKTGPVRITRIIDTSTGVGGSP